MHTNTHVELVSLVLLDRTDLPPPHLPILGIGVLPPCPTCPWGLVELKTIDAKRWATGDPRFQGTTQTKALP